MGDNMAIRKFWCSTSQMQKVQFSIKIKNIYNSFPRKLTGMSNYFNMRLLCKCFVNDIASDRKRRKIVH